MPKIVELSQDRAQICDNFGGYILSLEAVPILRHNLEKKPHNVQPNAEQYSLLHAELFSLQNLLQADPWARNSSYFINNLGEVMHSRYNEADGRAQMPQVVYRVPNECGGGDAMQRIPGDYNYSFRFISEKFCVLCDGIRQLFLLDTGDRRRTTEWKLVANTLITNTEAQDSIPKERNFMLYDCRLDIIQEQKQISIALGRVHRSESEDAGHFMHIHWAQWRHIDNIWDFSLAEILVGKGSLYYCAFEPRAESLIISSNRDFNFLSQYTAQNGSANLAEMDTLPLQTEDEAAAEHYPFTWSQTDQDVIITCEARDDSKVTDYVIASTVNKLTVVCKDETIIDGNLFDNVEQDLTTWTVENSSLKITLIKKKAALLWTSLLANGVGPQESTGNASDSCLPVEQQPIANLETPLEDCDFPMNMNDDEIKIVRFNLPTKSATHVVLLGATPPVFITDLRPGFPLAIATREGVDASIWLQKYNPNKPTEWSLRHEGNLHAFAYVQASKIQKKFTDCAPDLSYAIICEARRHVFLFKSNYAGADGLRNRNGPQSLVGTSKLITLEDTGDVLGMTTATNLVTLLTENCILHLQIL